jgi:hypothetical protein
LAIPLLNGTTTGDIIKSGNISRIRWLVGFDLKCGTISELTTARLYQNTRKDLALNTVSLDFGTYTWCWFITSASGSVRNRELNLQSKHKDDQSNEFTFFCRISQLLDSRSLQVNNGTGSQRWRFWRSNWFHQIPSGHAAGYFTD